MIYVTPYQIGYAIGYWSVIASFIVLVVYLLNKLVKYIIKLCKGDENEWTKTIGFKRPSRASNTLRI